ncbi:MAG: hypothetical protein IPM51_10090 [Sphingobacteriaceae bacterium]|nr:hypothetical protein [Sphingobacteriaceae bacterium]
MNGIIKNILLPFVCFAHFLSSCSETKKQTTNNPALLLNIKEKLKSHTKLIAAYEERSALVIFTQQISKQKNNFLKTTIYRNFPSFTDTLTLTDSNLYYSKKRNDSYLVKTDSVILIHDQKIIHPCSNWQGQTPWEERNIYRYIRTDNP